MKKQRWGSLPLQLFVFAILPLSVLLLLITFGSLLLHQQAMRAMIGERDERATRTVATALSDHLTYRGAAIRALALQATAVDNPDHALQDSAYLLANFEHGIALFNREGELLASSEGKAIWTGGRSDLFAELQKNPNNSDPFFFSQSAAPPQEGLLFIAAQTGDSIAVGALSLPDLAAETLADLIGPDMRTAAYVVSAGGEIIVDAGSLSPLIDNPRLHPAVIDALGGGAGTFFQTHNGTEYVIAYSPIPATGWALIVEEPWREVADPLLRATELAPLIMVPVLILALTVLWFGFRQIVQPLQELEKKASALAWGNYHAIESPVGGISEIQRLQNELVHMAGKVQGAQQSLRGYLGAVTAGQEEERRRLARDLHDDTIQSLIALNQQIQLAQQTTHEAEALAQLDQMQQAATQIVADLRRLTHNLRPIYLEDLGITPALQVLARDTSKTLGIPVHFNQTGLERRLDPPVELAFYRIAQEALSNVARHAAATSAEIDLRFSAQGVDLTIRDDGIGFELAENPAEVAAAGHFGLLGIQERAELIGAAFTIGAEPGRGTTLTISLPTVFLT